MYFNTFLTQLFFYFNTILTHIKLFFTFLNSESTENTAFSFFISKHIKKRENVDILTFSHFFFGGATRI